MAAGQLLGRAIDATRQFSIGNDRTGKGHGTDPDAQDQLDPQDTNLNGGFLGQKGREIRHGADHLIDRGGQWPLGLREGHAGSCQHFAHADQLDMGVETHENGGQTDQRMHDRHKLGHLGHLDLGGQLIAHARTRRDQDDRHEPKPRARPDQGGHDRNGHARNAIPNRALGAFLTRKPAQRQDEENARDRVGRNGETEIHLFYPCPLKISGTWRACAVSRGNRRRYSRRP